MPFNLRYLKSHGRLSLAINTVVPLDLHSINVKSYVSCLIYLAGSPRRGLFEGLSRAKVNSPVGSFVVPFETFGLRCRFASRVSANVFHDFFLGQQDYSFLIFRLSLLSTISEWVSGSS